MKSISALAFLSYVAIISADATDDSSRFSSGQTCAEAIPNGTPLLIKTSWHIDSATALTYPCSAIYARNFVANPNLRNDMLRAIDDTLDGCSRMCNINNAGYGTYSVTGDGDLTNVLPSHVCDAVDSSFNFEDGDESCVCKADEGNGVVSGCAYCSAQVTFIVDNCLDIVPSTLSPRRLRNRH